MNVLLLLLLSWHHTTGFEEKVAKQTAEPGYTTHRYDLDHHRYSIPIKIHARTGTVLKLSRPFDDAWASDNKGNATGRYYKFLRWGTKDGASVEDQMVISSVLFDDGEENMFLMVEGRVIEFVLSQTRDFHKADRMVYIDLVGGQGEPFLPKVTKPKAEPKTSVPWGRKGNRRGKAPNGTMVYNLKGRPFVYYQSNEGLPDMDKIEIVRAKKRRLSKGFHYEVPLEARVTQVGGGYLLEFPGFQLERGEHLYLRVKHQGERLAKTQKLKKRWWQRWRR